jgi:hypothetical protein
MQAHFGERYFCLDKGASSRLKKKGVGPLFVTMPLTDEAVAQIEENFNRQGKADHTFHVFVLNESGEVVAEVDKVLAIRKSRTSEARA